MKFKKYLLFLVIAALAVIVAACGNAETPETDTNGDMNEGEAML